MDAFTIIIIGLIVLIMLSILAAFIVEPSLYLTLFYITPRKFRLHKPKNDVHYYLQVKVLFKYYYICKTTSDDFLLYLSHDKFSLYYEDHYILSNSCTQPFKDKYEIIKYFTESDSPVDNINL